MGLWAEGKRLNQEKAALKAARASGEAPVSPIVEGTHYIAAVSVMGTPDDAYRKWLRIIDQRFPGQTFEIVSLQTHAPTGTSLSGWSVSGLIRRVGPPDA